MDNKIKKELENIKGTIFNIQKFSIHDGPGIRTLVFIKGCPLRCRWCSNPEGLIRDDQVMFVEKKCVGCTKCINVCQYDAIVERNGKFHTINKKCVGCGACSKVCYYDARNMAAKEKSAREIVDVVKRDSLFYKDNGGGVTVGGGEMLSQADFAYAILSLAKAENISTAIESSACGNKGDLLKIASVTDHIFVDIKAISLDLHISLTKIDNELILSNIQALDEFLISDRNTNKSNLIIRIPIIPDCNNSVDEIIKIGDFIKALKGEYVVELLPFHNFGELKYDELDLLYEFKGVKNFHPEDLDDLKETLVKMGLSVIVAGNRKN